jgi:Beta-propeller repeat
VKRLWTAILPAFIVIAIVSAEGRTSPAIRAVTNASKIDRATPQSRTTYGRLPLSFEANEGQTDSQVKFLARGRKYTLFLTATEAVLTLGTSGSVSPRADDGRFRSMRGPERVESSRQAVVRMTTVGARRDAEIEGVDLLPGRINYLLGRDPMNWRRGIQSYGRVRYREVYAGIDLVYYGREGELEYDFIVAPAASPRDILLEFDGAAFSVDANGDLVGGIKDGEIRMRRPSVYQEIAGVRVPIHGEWALTAGGRARVEIGDYDRTKPLVIDPMLAYSTYLGGSKDDGPTDVAVDAAGNAYMTGFTTSPNFPTTAGAFQTTFRAAQEAFVTKLDPTGSTLVYSTYIGGTGNEIGQAIAVDAAGTAYVAGTTQSNDFPTTPGAFQTTGGGPIDAFANDGFVAKLDAAGSSLVYSTYLGGTDTDSIDGLAVDAAAGNAYVTGSTLSGDFPTTPGVLQTEPASGLPAPPVFQPSRYDAFVTKLNATGSALVYSTYLGGTEQDTAADISVDALGNAYVTGTTRSENFPTTPGAFQQSGGGFTESAFVTKLDPSASALGYSTYLEGSHHEFGAGIVVDAVGHAYVTGGTQSVDFPTTPGAVQPSIGGDADAFVTKLNPSGSGPVYSTYLGGSGQDWAEAIALDLLGNAYVTGPTRSTDFPLGPGAWQPTFGGGFSDSFVAKLDGTGSDLVYASFLGGSHGDFASGIAVDPTANAYATGLTISLDFPVTAGAFQTTFGGLRDGYVAKIAAEPAAPSAAGKVTGGGSVGVGGGVATFAFSVQRKTSGEPIGGRLQFINHATRVTIRSVSLTSLLIAGNVATISGTCTEDGAPCIFEATVTDNGEPGTSDTFLIAVSSGSPEGGLLRGGNIQVHD